jgi:predicted transcriptional regulator
MAKVMISLPDGFLVELDEAARKRHQTRSELVRAAVREYLERRWREFQGSEGFLLREEGQQPAQPPAETLASDEHAEGDAAQGEHL